MERVRTLGAEAGAGAGGDDGPQRSLRSWARALGAGTGRVLEAGAEPAQVLGVTVPGCLPE